jgi:hypothetical protein
MQFVASEELVARVFRVSTSQPIRDTYLIRFKNFPNDGVSELERPSASRFSTSFASVGLASTRRDVDDIRESALATVSRLQNLNLTSIAEGSIA